jgi:hypothetical protein
MRDPLQQYEVEAAAEWEALSATKEHGGAAAEASGTMAEAKSNGDTAPKASIAAESIRHRAGFRLFSVQARVLLEVLLRGGTSPSGGEWPRPGQT